MKVLYVLSGTDPCGGSTKAFYNLYKEVINLGIEPIVFCPQKNGIYDLLKKDGIELATSDFRFKSWPGTRGKDIFLFIPRVIFRATLHTLAYIRLYFFAKRTRPDIIHSNVSVIDLGYLVARRLHIKHVWHIREYGLLDFGIRVAPSYKVFIERLNDSINHCICITKGIKQYHKLDDNRSTVIYDGVMSKNSIRCKIDKKNYFLFAGRLEKAKAVEMCISSFKTMVDNTHSKSELWIAGAPIENSYLDSLKKQSIGYNIKFLGPRSDIYDLMYEAKALVVPSANEGFGFITAEAIFNGCLVLGRNTAGTKEQMDNGLSIVGKEIAFRFEDEIELARLIANVDQKDFTQYREMVLLGQQVVSSLYSTESHAEKVVALYKKILYES